MRKFISVVILFLAVQVLHAQDCGKYYFLTSSEIQMTLFDKKGEETGNMTYKIADIKSEGGTTSASFTSEMINQEGKSISKSSGTYKCTGGVLFVDARASMPGEQMGPYKDMDVKASDSYIEYPASFTDGQSLNDVDFKMEVSDRGRQVSTVTFQQTNRKVVGKESITTPAGTWDCVKISYDAKIRSAMAPLNIGVPITFSSTEWFAPGFGIVKTETFDKKGKLMGSTQITSVKK